ISENPRHRRLSASNSCEPPRNHPERILFGRTRFPQILADQISENPRDRRLSASNSFLFLFLLRFILLVPHELLSPFAVNVARVQVSFRVECHAVNPIAFAWLLMAVGRLGHCPNLKQLTARVEFHKNLVLGRAPQYLIALTPRHR